MSTSNPVPTLAQAQQASFVVDLCNNLVTQLNGQLANVQQQITSLQNYNPAADLVAAQNQLAAIQYALTTVQAQLAAEAAIITQYNAANPSAAIPVG
jgi:hypothetical protein